MEGKILFFCSVHKLYKHSMGSPQQGSSQKIKKKNKLLWLNCPNQRFELTVPSLECGMAQTNQAFHFDLICAPWIVINMINKKSYFLESLMIWILLITAKKKSNRKAGLHLKYPQYMYKGLYTKNCANWSADSFLFQIGMQNY